MFSGDAIPQTFNIIPLIFQTSKSSTGISSGGEAMETAAADEQANQSNGHHRQPFPDSEHQPMADPLEKEVWYLLFGW